MLSITQYISEGFLGNIDKKFQQTALAKTMDKANDKIDNLLGKSSIGRGYMKLENATGEAARQGVNAVLNTKDRILRKNFKTRK
jgi:hypothetical protein